MVSHAEMVSPTAMVSHPEMVSPTAMVSHPEMVSPAAMVNGRPFAHARMLKVQSLFDWPRYIGQR